MIVVEKLSVGRDSFSLDGVDLRVEQGEYGVLMGKTGCGKTTLLEAICGLIPTRGGRVELDGVDSTRLRPAERGIGYVPQDAALFDTLTVGGNLAFALKVRKWARGEATARVHEIAEMLGLEPLLGRSVTGLSGGEIQRVALGRALSFRPRILCLDEPLSALDHEAREEMCDLLESIKNKTRVTTLHVTHSRNEAARLADRLFQFSGGEVREVQSP